MMAQKQPHVRIGVNKWFKSDINLIKQFTQLIVKNDEEEDSLQASEDLNALKFAPHAVHISKSHLFSVEEPQRSHTAVTELVSYCLGLKDEEKIRLIIDDQTFESNSADIVDFAFANQIEYVNL